MIIQFDNFGYRRDVRYQFVKECYNYGTHIHEFAEIVIPTKGDLTVTVDGKSEVLSPGKAALVFPFQAHSFHSTVENEISIFVFSTALVSDFFKKTKDMVGESSVFSISHDCLNVFNSRIKAKTTLSLYETTGFFYLLLSDFYEQVKMLPSDKTGNVSQKVIEYIKENIADDVSLAAMAASLGYSPKYLSNCINKRFGMSVPNIVSALRVEAVKPLLIGTDKSGVEICFECGFGSERSFHRQFKEITGMSPREYRTRHHNVTIEKGVVTSFDSQDDN